MGKAVRFAMVWCVVCGVTATATAANLIENPNFASSDVTVPGTSANTWGADGARAAGWTTSLTGASHYLFKMYGEPLSVEGKNYWYHDERGGLCGCVATSTMPVGGGTGVLISNAMSLDDKAAIVQSQAHFLSSNFLTVFSIKEAAVASVSSGSAQPFNSGNLKFSLIDSNDQMVTLINENGEEVTSFTYRGLTHGEGWKTVTATFTVKESGDYRVKLMQYGGVLFLTDASLETAAPEPGTWAMLAGLGVVGAAWYRRRCCRK